VKRFKKYSPPVPAETCGDSRHRGHRVPNPNKRAKRILPVQVSLKYIWEALMEKISSFIFSIRGFPYVPI
jgi:hypothetical protein